MELVQGRRDAELNETTCIIEFDSCKCEADGCPYND